MDVFQTTAGLIRELRRAVRALGSLIERPAEETVQDAGAPPAERFRWESDMLEPVARSVDVLAPWLKAPGAIVAEVPAAIGVVDLVAVRFDPRSLRNRSEAGIAPILSPLRVRVLHALLGGRARHLDELAASVGSREDALLRSTLRPLAAGELIELHGDTARSTGMWLPAADRIIAVELKLAKWRDALNQADNFARSADEAWVVLDGARAAGALDATGEFAERGVGLAAITPSGALEILRRPPKTRPVGWLRALIAERALAAANPRTAERASPAAPRPQSEPRAVALMS